MGSEILCQNKVASSAHVQSGTATRVDTLCDSRASTD